MTLLTILIPFSTQYAYHLDSGEIPGFLSPFLEWVAFECALSGGAGAPVNTIRAIHKAPRTPPDNQLYPWPQPADPSSSAVSGDLSRAGAAPGASALTPRRKSGRYRSAPAPSPILKLAARGAARGAGATAANLGHEFANRYSCYGLTERYRLGGRSAGGGLGRRICMRGRTRRRGPRPAGRRDSARVANAG
ncbi:hypothetical protein EVAR_19516_1 [Eumeta japonica]|uniref:Uncharacterized protein n=1 Tax=Eumeta variegata TaxID=151549 RepID=A0A4C1UGF4_EUMVA|nr:hypothetical protein EVAR_19516_1 [Eumeta japonica]